LIKIIVEVTAVRTHWLVLFGFYPIKRKEDMKKKRIMRGPKSELYIEKILKKRNYELMEIRTETVGWATCISLRMCKIGKRKSPLNVAKNRHFYLTTMTPNNRMLYSVEPFPNET
jgi:hypothetical protein